MGSIPNRFKNETRSWKQLRFQISRGGEAGQLTISGPSHSSRCAINLYFRSESYSPLALLGVTKTEERTSAPLLLQQLTQVANPFAFENRTKLGVATITLRKIVTVFITECPN